MVIKLPGQAEVQYGDLRGEAAADIADAHGTLQSVGDALGFKLKGVIVGISMYAATTFDDKVHVTVQVFNGGSRADVKSALDASGGTLDVTEHNMIVPAVDFLRCFKRLNIGLFQRDSGVREVHAIEG